MSRRSPIFTQSDIARAIRAAKQTGAGLVQIGANGSIFIHLDKDSIPNECDVRVPESQEIVEF